MRRLTKLGLGITAAWLLVFGGFILRDLDAACAMTLNELGDFLAGASAPLALLWLVIGYFQHGEELRLNTMALHVQQEELRRQVEETATLARSAERQAKASEELALLNKADQEREAVREELDAQPVFVEGGGRSGRNGYETNIQNRGGEITDIELNYGGPYTVTISTQRRLTQGGKATVTVDPGREALVFPVRFRMEYTDRLDKRREKEFELGEQHEFREVRETET